jgi:hypothetical protein
MSVQWSGSKKNVVESSSIKVEMSLGVFFLATGLLAAFVVGILDKIQAHDGWISLAGVIIGGCVLALALAAATYRWTKQ